MLERGVAWTIGCKCLTRREIPRTPARVDHARNGAQALELTPDFASSERFFRLTRLKRFDRHGFFVVSGAPRGCETG
jgi:hypothetical protein